MFFGRYIDVGLKICIWLGYIELVAGEERVVTFLVGGGVGWIYKIGG